MNSRIQPQQPTGIILKKQNIEHVQQNNQANVTCRICLEQGVPLHIKNLEQGENINKSKDKQKYLIKNCNCDGTAGYVHQRCMGTWIDAQIKRTKNRHIKCQICLSQVIYNRKKYYELQCKSQACLSISPCNVVCTIALLVGVIVVSYLYMRSTQISLSNLIANILLGLIGFLSFVLAICIFFVLKDAFYKQKFATSKVYSLQQIQLMQLQVNQFSHYQIRSSHRANSERSQRSRRSNRTQSRRNHPRSDRSIQSRQASININIQQNHHPQNEI